MRCNLFLTIINIYQQRCLQGRHWDNERKKQCHVVRGSKFWSSLTGINQKVKLMITLYNSVSSDVFASFLWSLYSGSCMFHHQCLYLAHCIFHSNGAAIKEYYIAFAKFSKILYGLCPHAEENNIGI